MKHLTDNKPVRLVMLLIGLSLAGCGSSLTYQEALEKNRNQFETREQRDDAEFVVEAQSLNLLLLALGDLALERGYSADLVEMIRQNQKDHETLEEELEKMERREDIKLPTRMSSEHHRWLEEAEDVRREEFDRTLVRILQRVNGENEYRYREEATEANDEDIRSFAARRLGLFERHRDRLDKVEDRLLTTY